MPKKTVKRCIRPQCMAIYNEADKNSFCLCGASLQVVEIEIKAKPKKDSFKKDKNVPPKKPSDMSRNRGETKKAKDKVSSRKSVPDIPNPKPDSSNYRKDTEKKMPDEILKEPDSFQGTSEQQDKPKMKKAYLYLLLDEEDIEFELSNITRIGRVSEGVRVDVDLSEYAGKEVSREHAVIRKEKDGYYLTNVSRTHSVRVIDSDENTTSLDYGKKVLLKTGDGIILSKKILLQFEERE